MDNAIGSSNPDEHILTETHLVKIIDDQMPQCRAKRHQHYLDVL